MGFGDYLRANTPSKEKLYKKIIDGMIEEIKTLCKSVSEQGDSRCSSGVTVEIPFALSKRERKQMVKQIVKDGEDILLEEGFTYVNMREDSDFSTSTKVFLRYTCEW